MSGADGVRPPDGPSVAVSRADLYSSLVTRPTGRAVRLGIEEQVAGREGSVVTVLDFREVSVIDFSCADEVAAKLASSAVEVGGERAGELYFLFTGLGDHHLDPVESALRRRGLVVAAERADGTPLVVGELDEAPRRAWEHLCRAGGARAADVARALELEAEAAARRLEALWRRRLVLRRDDEFLSLRRVVSRARRDREAG